MDLVIVHLVLIHTLMLLTRVVTVSASTQHLRLLQTDVGCQTFAAVYWVTRGLSISTTGFMSTVQVVIISPSSSLWAQLKARVQKTIFTIFILLWLLNSIVDINLLFDTIASPSVISREPRFSDDYCSIKPISSLVGLFLFFMSLCDLLSVGIMGSSSGYMVFLLF
ncbi:putative vomeronasal receptor-like protein 4 [Tachyglossus aculeatus]|uniref:putative vomeronasal receptor-like protein 4 n=1 Tax=Tachyglossus aculeatus TaxID=9261 RepID=UPI0018F45C33|nr:putative vomeronasal receptor-like protein 4 [Tachyglossus aculeatus]